MLRPLMTRATAIIAAGWFAVLLSTGCQAPHDNPLDPDSPYYRRPLPPERIDDLSFDSLQAERCRIFWTAPEGAVSYRLYNGPSGWSGRTPEGGSLYTGDLPDAAEPGAVQSAWIVLSAGETLAWSLFSVSAEGLLSEGSNKLVIAAPRRDRPAVVVVAAHAVREGQWFGGDVLDLEVVATVADSDSVELVWWEWEGDNDSWTLSPEGDGLHWSRRFPEGLEPVLNLEDMVGRPLTLRHLDRAGFVSDGVEFHLVRVIEDVPRWVYPAPDDTVATPWPLLEWEPFEAGFDYTYGVSIYHLPEDNPNAPVLVYARNGIPSDKVSHQVEDSLTAEPLFLFWTLTVTDDFGDRSVSLESSFSVRSDG